SQETGGSFFFPDRIADLIKIFSDISDELHNHYLLAYTPKRPPDGTWREIQVHLLNNKDAEVRVRKGYFAVKRRRTPRATTTPGRQAIPPPRPGPPGRPGRPPPR